MKISTLFNLSSVCISMLVLTSCSGNYQVSTNLDKKNFTEYFAASKVTIFDSENNLPKNSKLVGIVEGQDCQLKPHLAAPDKIIARTNARKKAYKLNANAIVFSSCATIEDQMCHSLILCYGKAYQTPKSQNNIE